MAEWCMAHPWMTFWIIVIGIVCVCEAVEAWARKRS